MMETGSNSYFLKPDALASLAQGMIGNLTAVLTLKDGAIPFTLLDTFDQSLRRSGRMLLEIGETLELLMSDGRVLSQPAERNGRFVTDFQAGAIKQSLSDLSPLRSLSPVGSGDVRRGMIAVLDDDHKTHCRAYLQIFASDGEERGALVTLQGLRGYGKSLGELRLHLEACGGAPLSFGEIYAEIFPEQNGYDAKPEVSMAPDDTAFDAATNIISAHFPVARANEGGIIEDHDTGFLHDYRIALRKIRSVLSLFKGVYEKDQSADLKARLSDLMKPTGRLRDLDVYLLERQRSYDLLPDTLHGGLDTLFRMLAEERMVEKAKLARHLASKTYEKEVAELAKLFMKRKKLRPGPAADLNAHDYARDLIWNRYRKICSIAGGIGPSSEDAEVHMLRIHCKKLRYLMEFFGSLFPEKDFKTLLMPLKRLQDDLGQFNDHSVQQVSLQDFLWKGNNWPDGVDLEVAQSVGALTAVLHRQQLELRAKVVESFAQFNGPKKQKKFRHLFHQRRDTK